MMQWCGWGTARRGAGRALISAVAALAICALLLPGSASAASITLQWTAPGDNGSSGRADLYQIHQSSAAPGSDLLAWWNSATVVPQSLSPKDAGSAESFAVSGLTAGSRYYFAIRAADEVGNLSAVSNVASATAPIFTPALDTIPPGIDSVATADLGATTVTILWQTDEPARGEIRYGVGGDYSLPIPVGTAYATHHAAVLTGLAPEEAYDYRVAATDTAGNWADAGPFSFVTTAFPDTSPPVVSGLTVTPLAGTECLIRWATNEPARAWVEYDTTTAYGATSPQDLPFDVAHEVTLVGLASGSTYHFRIVAGDSLGNSGATGDLTFATPADSLPSVPSDTTAPAVASAEAVILSKNSARVTWATNEPTRGDLLYQPVAGGFEYAARDTVLGDAHVIELSGLAEGTTFTYRIAARDTASNLAVAGPWEFTTPSGADLIPPALREIKTLVIRNDSIVVSWWSDELSDGQVEYGEAPHISLATPIDTSLTYFHAVRIGSLEPGASYSYRVLSRDRAGNLARSADGLFSMPSPPVDPGDTTAPVAAGIASDVPSPSRAIITWNTDEPAYGQIAYGPGENRTTYSAPATVTSTHHVVTLEGLAPDVDWSFVAISTDPAGNQSISEPHAFHTPSAGDITPPQISGLTVGGITSFAAVVSWDTGEPADGQVEYGLTTAYGLATPINLILRTDHSIRLSGLSAGATYHLRALSRDGAGNLTVGEDATFETPPVAPAPTDTVAPAINGLSLDLEHPFVVRLVWETSEPAQGEVEYGLSPDYGSIVRTGEGFASSHEITLSGLSAGMLFHYRVVSRDETGNAAFTADGTFITPGDTIPPAMPSTVSAKASDKGFEIAWTSPEDPDVAGFRVYRSTGGPFELVLQASAAETSLVDEDQGTMQRSVAYAVATVDRAGNESEWALVTLSTRPGDLSIAPNPLVTSTLVRFRVPAAPSGTVTTLSVYNVAGALVREIMSEPLTPGLHEVVWGGVDWRGDRVAGGIYFLRLTSGGTETVRKVAVLR